jgi:hypothetical protein
MDLFVRFSNMVAKVVVPSDAYRVQYRAKYKEFLVADFLDLNTV